MTQSAERSAEACPVCGAHELTLLEFPSLSTVGYQPYNEIVGMGEPGELSPPAIGCLACGAQWADLAAFRKGAAGRSPV
jgi:hypothetical protein